MEQHLQAMTKEEAEYYFRFMVAVCKSDGDDIDEREKNYINLQAELIGLDNADQYWDEDFDLDHSDAGGISDAAKLSIIRDCIVIANIDNEYHELERKKIFEIASEIGVTEEKVLEIESWLQEYWVVLEKGVRIFSPE